MTYIYFTIPHPPVPKARARVTRTGAYTPQKTKAYEALVRHYAKQAMEGKPPLLQAIKMQLVFGMPVPKSLSKAKRQALQDNDLFPISKPDIDNLAKAVMDGMNGIVFKDDSQVTSLFLVKRYSLEPFTKVAATLDWERE